MSTKIVKAIGYIFIDTMELVSSVLVKSEMRRNLIKSGIERKGKRQKEGNTKVEKNRKIVRKEMHV